MLNYPNLKRHFQTIHPDTVLSTTIRCLICNNDSDAQAASVHCKRAHGVSKTDPKSSPSPTPIMPCIDTNLGLSATSDALSDRFRFRVLVFVVQLDALVIIIILHLLISPFCHFVPHNRHPQVTI